MRGSSTPKPLGASRIFLILVYALTFYFGPQFAGGTNDFEKGSSRASETTGSATGGYLINIFNDNFELNDL